MRLREVTEWRQYGRRGVGGGAAQRGRAGGDRREQPVMTVCHRAATSSPPDPYPCRPSCRPSPRCASTSQNGQDRPLAGTRPGGGSHLGEVKSDVEGHSQASKHRFAPRLCAAWLLRFACRQRPGRSHRTKPCAGTGRRRSRLTCRSAAARPCSSRTAHRQATPPSIERESHRGDAGEESIK